MSLLHFPDITFSPAIESSHLAIFNQHEASYAPHADGARMRQSARDAKAIYQRYQSIRQVVVVGTGGSTLGAKMLCVFGRVPSRVLFAETVDVHSIQAVLQQVDLAHTLFIVTSKSGSTLETLSLYALFAQHYALHELPEHFVFISDPTAPGAAISPLRQLAARTGITVEDHPSDIGGRYSIFTIVGLLPALFAEVDIDALIDGAISYASHPFWQRSAAWNWQAYQQHKTITVLLPYIDRLYHYTYWWRQLWAESLGKNGYFTTPFASLGSIDQHSQLQLWLGGKADKSFTLISALEDTLSIQPDYLPADVFPCLHGQTTQSIQHALVQGTIHSLTQAGLPVCHIHFSRFTVRELGLLIMHGLAEIMALAEHLKVNPFDQPAVEIGKSCARQLLLAQRPA